MYIYKLELNDFECNYNKLFTSLVKVDDWQSEVFRLLKISYAKFLESDYYANANQYTIDLYKSMNAKRMREGLSPISSEGYKVRISDLVLGPDYITDVFVESGYTPYEVPLVATVSLSSEIPINVTYDNLIDDSDAVLNSYKLANFINNG